MYGLVEAGGDRRFIMDVALSETVVKGFVLAGRTISPAAGFSMSTGAGLPVDRDSLKRIATELPRQFGMTSDEIVRMSPEKASEFSASIIRILLEGDAASRMRFEDVVTTARKASSMSAATNRAPAVAVRNTRSAADAEANTYSRKYIYVSSPLSQPPSPRLDHLCYNHH